MIRAAKMDYNLLNDPRFDLRGILSERRGLRHFRSTQMGQQSAARCRGNGLGGRWAFSGNPDEWPGWGCTPNPCE